MRISDMVAAANKIASDAFNVGYDQGQRWSFFNRATKELIPGRETDCSAACGAIAVLGGYPVDLSDPFYTGNLEQRFVAAGMQSINVSGWSAAKLFGAVQTGDFVLGPGHVVFAISANRWLSPQNDEYGRSSGGKSGDQTGREVFVRAPYMRSKGWTRILRPMAEMVAQPLPVGENLVVKTGVAPNFPLGRCGRHGSTSYFGPKSGPDHSVSGYYNRRSNGARGHDGLATWQSRMATRGWNISADGLYGPKTAEVATKFQREKGLAVDGQIGPSTWRAAWTAPVT